MPEEQLTLIKEAVSEGRASNVSSYISQTITKYQSNTALRDLLDDLDAEYGPVTDPAAFAWAESARRASRELARHGFVERAA